MGIAQGDIVTKMASGMPATAGHLVISMSRLYNLHTVIVQSFHPKAPVLRLIQPKVEFINIGLSKICPKLHLHAQVHTRKVHVPMYTCIHNMHL